MIAIGLDLPAGRNESGQSKSAPFILKFLEKISALGLGQIDRVTETHNRKTVGEPRTHETLTLTLTHDLDLQSPRAMIITHTHTKNQDQKSVDTKDKQTDGRTKPC